MEKRYASLEKKMSNGNCQPEEPKIKLHGEEKLELKVENIKPRKQIEELEIELKLYKKLVDPELVQKVKDVDKFMAGG